MWRTIKNFFKGLASFFRRIFFGFVTFFRGVMDYMEDFFWNSSTETPLGALNAKLNSKEQKEKAKEEAKDVLVARVGIIANNLLYSADPEELELLTLAQNFLANNGEARQGPSKYIFDNYKNICRLLYPNIDSAELSVKAMLEVIASNSDAITKQFLPLFDDKRFIAFLQKKASDNNVSIINGNSSYLLLWVLYLENGNDFKKWIACIKPILETKAIENEVYVIFLKSLLYILIYQIKHNIIDDEFCNLVLKEMRLLEDKREFYSIGYFGLYQQTLKMLGQRYWEARFQLQDNDSSAVEESNTEIMLVKDAFSLSFVERGELFEKELEDYIISNIGNYNSSDITNVRENSQYLLTMQNDINRFNLIFYEYTFLDALNKLLQSDDVVFDAGLVCCFLARPDFIKNLLEGWHKEVASWSKKPQTKENLFSFPLGINHLRLIGLINKNFSNHPFIKCYGIENSLKELEQNIQSYLNLEPMMRSIFDFRDDIEDLRKRAYDAILAKRDANWQKGDFYATFLPYTGRLNIGHSYFYYRKSSYNTSEGVRERGKDENQTAGFYIIGDKDNYYVRFRTWSSADYINWYHCFWQDFDIPADMMGDFAEVNSLQEEGHFVPSDKLISSLESLTRRTNCGSLSLSAPDGIYFYRRVGNDDIVPIILRFRDENAGYPIVFTLPNINFSSTNPFPADGLSFPLDGERPFQRRISKELYDWLAKYNLFQYECLNDALVIPDVLSEPFPDELLFAQNQRVAESAPQVVEHDDTDSVVHLGFLDNLSKLINQHPFFRMDVQQAFKFNTGLLRHIAEEFYSIYETIYDTKSVVPARGACVEYSEIDEEMNNLKSEIASQSDLIWIFFRFLPIASVFLKPINNNRRTDMPAITFSQRISRDKQILQEAIDGFPDKLFRDRIVVPMSLAETKKVLMDFVGLFSASQSMVLSELEKLKIYIRMYNLIKKSKVSWAANTSLESFAPLEKALLETFQDINRAAVKIDGIPYLVDYAIGYFTKFFEFFTVNSMERLRSVGGLRERQLVMFFSDSERILYYRIFANGKENCGQIVYSHISPEFSYLTFNNYKEDIISSIQGKDISLIKWYFESEGSNLDSAKSDVDKALKNVVDSADYSALTRRKLHRNDLNSGIHQDLSTIVVGGYVTNIFQVTANELKEEFGGRINELTQTVNDMRAENQTLSQNMQQYREDMQAMSSQHQEAMQSMRTENQTLSQNIQAMSSQHQEAMQSIRTENQALNQKMDTILQQLITNSQNQQPPGNGLNQQLPGNGSNQQPPGNTQYANQYPGFFSDGVPNTPPPYEDIQQSNNSQTPNGCSVS